MSLLQTLTPRHLGPALALAARSFPTDVGYRWALPVCAMPDELAALRAAAGLQLTRQWIVTDGAEGVAGTFGLYAAGPELDVEEPCVLLNWFCVHPDVRGRGLGRRLWAHTLAEAEAAGARRLIFYSSNEPEHLAAERFYLAAGCARRLGPELGDGPYHLTYFDRPLGATPPADAPTVRRIDAALERYVAMDSDLSLVGQAEAAGQVAAFACAA